MSPTRKCTRGACRRPLIGQASLCDYHLREIRQRNRGYYRRRVGIAIDAPLLQSGRPREESLIAPQS
jgi:hypothetical protein